ncbi:MAG TPA: hypothetical protein VN800_04285 [Candidatus Acidoferrales bacterium]|nr:hypothetical protein [Candidatus Acidoferrales bacterium]
MGNGIEPLRTIRSRLQERDDTLTRSLELLEHEREIVRRELGLVNELTTLEEQRVAADAPGEPPTALVPGRESTVDPQQAVELEPARVPTGLAEPQTEPAAASASIPQPVVAAEPQLALVAAEPQVALAAEALSDRSVLVEALSEVAPTPEAQAEPASDAEPVREPVSAGNVALLRRVEKLERLRETLRNDSTALGRGPIELRGVMLRDAPAQSEHVPARLDARSSPVPVSQSEPWTARLAPRSSGSSDTVLDSGRYAGWSLGQIARNDPDFLQKFSWTPAGRRYRTEIDALLTPIARTATAVADPVRSGRSRR